MRYERTNRYITEFDSNDSSRRGLNIDFISRWRFTVESKTYLLNQRHT